MSRITPFIFMALEKEEKQTAMWVEKRERKNEKGLFD